MVSGLASTQERHGFVPISRLMGVPRHSCDEAALNQGTLADLWDWTNPRIQRYLKMPDDSSRNREGHLTWIPEIYNKLTQRPRQCLILKTNEVRIAASKASIKSSKQWRYQHVERNPRRCKREGSAVDAFNHHVFDGRARTALWHSEPSPGSCDPDRPCTIGGEHMRRAEQSRYLRSRFQWLNIQDHAQFYCRSSFTGLQMRLLANRSAS